MVLGVHVLFGPSLFISGRGNKQHGWHPETHWSIPDTILGTGRLKDRKGSADSGVGAVIGYPYAECLISCDFHRTLHFLCLCHTATKMVPPGPHPPKLRNTHFMTQSLVLVLRDVKAAAELRLRLRWGHDLAGSGPYGPRFSLRRRNGAKRAQPVLRRWDGDLRVLVGGFGWASHILLIVVSE